ncbi:MAG: CDP-alcohol phosphatidyltransferase family protein [Candidatus Acidiferrales bacterium]
MLTRRIAQPFEWLLQRIVAGIAATGVPPNLLTWSSLILNLWAGILFGAGRFAAAGGMMILAGFFDIVDGPVARKQGRVTVFGGFLDSILDRYSDLILFLGLLIYYSQVNRFAYACLAGIAMSGAVMVSYARARAESLIGKVEVGFWERPERIVLMIIGGLANRMPLALWILAIGPNITVIHRIIYTWQRTKAEPEADEAAIAQAKAQIEIGTPHDVREAPALISRTAHRGG